MLNIYKKTYKSLVGKVILLLLLTIFTNVAISLSAQVVNEVTGVNPSSFPHTQTILAILMIPLLAVGVGGILLFGALILSPLILMFHITDDEFKKFIIPGYSKDNILNFQKTTRIIQFVSSIAFVGFIIGLSQKASGSYSAFVSDTARLYIYNMEMYSKAPCAIEGGGKFVFIGEEKILLGIKNSSGIDFKLEECKTKF